MNVDLITSLLWPRHNSLKSILWNLPGNIFQMARYQSYFHRIVSGASPVQAIASLVVGSIWTPGIVETATGLMHSIRVLRYATSRLPWAFKRVPTDPQLALACRELTTAQQEIQALDEQYWATMTANIPLRFGSKLRSVWTGLSTHAIQAYFDLGEANRDALTQTGIAAADIKIILNELYKISGNRDIRTYLKERHKLEETKERAQRAVSAAGHGQESSRALIAEVNQVTRSSIINSLEHVTVSLFVGLGLFFSIAQKAYTKEEFAKAQFGGMSPNRVSDLCAAPNANVGRVASSVSTLMTGAARSMTWIGVLLQMKDDYRKTEGQKGTKILNFIKQKMPYHLFIVGWYGMAPAALTVSPYLLMAPLAMKCAYQVLNPSQVEGSSALDCLADPQRANPTDLTGIAIKLLVGYYLPLDAWRLREGWLLKGDSYFTAFYQDRNIYKTSSSIGQQVFKCAVFDQLRD